MANNKIQMPSSMGGLIRYFDEYKSRLNFKPGHVIILCVVVMIMIILLHIYGPMILG